MEFFLKIDDDGLLRNLLLVLFHLGLKFEDPFGLCQGNTFTDKLFDARAFELFLTNCFQAIDVARFSSQLRGHLLHCFTTGDVFVDGLVSLLTGKLFFWSFY